MRLKMKKLYNSEDLEAKKDRTPHIHFTWSGIIVPSIIAIVVLGIVFFLLK
jgi:hypothetical protein